MTLSNFLKTDKESLKWFLLSPSGHEGPYSLLQLEGKFKSKKIDESVKVWCEGLGNPVSLRELLSPVEIPSDLPSLPEEEFALPPLPIEDEEAPMEFSEEVVGEASELVTKKSSKSLFFVLAIVLLGGFTLHQWLKTQENFKIRRHPKMSLDLFERVQKEHAKFEGWDKKIFFKESVPADLSRIWLITSSFQTCQVEATFTSIKEKLLSPKTEDVQFKTEGILEQHVVEFSKFDFIQGSKIVPGLYEMDVMAKNCEWGSLAAKLGNIFRPAEETYMGRLKVILYGKGPQEFNAILDKLVKRKVEAELANQNQEELFWQDLQQKFQTLLAISLQIEQLMLDLIEKDAREFDKNLKPMVDQYAKKFGHFLTRFVIDNEAYFKELDKKELKNNENKKTYEILLRSTAKRIGLESMKIIEGFQAEKDKMKRARLNEYSSQVKKTFEKLKGELNEKIIQTSEDRSP